MSCGCKKPSMSSTVVVPKTTSSCGCKTSPKKTSSCGCESKKQEATSSCGCGNGKKVGCKTFNVGVWNAKTIYQNSKEVQDFVKYHGALYAFINECTPTACVDPEEDTKNGSIRGQYWLQLVKDGITPSFQLDDTGKYLMISWDEGNTWNYVTTSSGDRMSLVGKQGKSGTMIQNVTASSTAKYDDVDEPKVDVSTKYSESTGTIHFDFSFSFPDIAP